MEGFECGSKSSSQTIESLMISLSLSLLFSFLYDFNWRHYIFIVNPLFFIMNILSLAPMDVGTLDTTKSFKFFLLIFSFFSPYFFVNITKIHDLQHINIYIYIYKQKPYVGMHEVLSCGILILYLVFFTSFYQVFVTITQMFTLICFYYYLINL